MDETATANPYTAMTDTELAAEVTRLREAIATKRAVYEAKKAERLPNGQPRHKFHGDCSGTRGPTIALDAVQREIIRRKPVTLTPARLAEQAANPDCTMCMSNENFQPTHQPKARCNSGGRTHCTCPLCWG